MQNRYPLWKNLLLLFIFVIGLIYATPNLFGNDPSIQISASNETAFSSNTLPQVKQILQKAKLNYLTAVQENENLLVRFSDTDTQLKAREELKSALGENYIVAVNLAPRTPKWLLALGANPMKMGLDLQGGVHFLLEVGTNDLLRAHAESDLHAIGDNLRTEGIRYVNIARKQPQGLAIHFRDQASLDRAFAIVSQHFTDYIWARTAVNGDFALQATLSEAAVFKVVSYAVEQTMNILRTRVNLLGVSEAIVQQQGPNHISVDLPGVQDTARAKDIIGKTATLRFQMVDVEHDTASALAGDIPIGSKLYQYENRPILLKEQVILQGSAITYATASYSQDGRPAVSVRLGGGGESLFSRTTAENIGKPMAVVYVETKTEEKMVDGKPVQEAHQEQKIISVATIQSALGMNFEITGLRSDKYAANLALLLRSGALEAPLSFVEESTIGPSAGKSNIHKGVISIVVGFIFVVLFMALYYRLFGLISDMALFLNLIFIVAISSILGVTMTLPSVAGIVLTVGMAVDANVLIYERIREELRNGISPQASIYSGYSRALVTIVDANVTTLIVALVLFALGSGSVKGFAVMLTIGLMTSMMTSIVFTRAVINLIYGSRVVKKISIGLPKKK